MKTCVRPNCNNKVFSHGFCKNHVGYYYLGRPKERGKKSKKKISQEWMELIKARSEKGILKPVSNQVLSAATRDDLILSNDKVQQLLSGVRTSDNGSYANVQRGEYLCSKGYVYFRSKWEANYALYLDFLVKAKEIQGWEYETETFFFEEIKFGTNSYRPDFKITNKDDSAEYHEVKGFMDSKSKTKLRRMRKYYPHIKVVLIDAEYYKGLVKQFKTALKFY